MDVFLKIKFIIKVIWPFCQAYYLLILNLHFIKSAISLIVEIPIFPIISN